MYFERLFFEFPCLTAASFFFTAAALRVRKTAFALEPLINHGPGFTRSEVLPKRISVCNNLSFQLRMKS